MLYIKDQSDVYLPAPKDAVFSEARRLSRLALRHGTYIRSPHAAGMAIREMLGEYPFEMFACLFLNSAHQVLAFVELFRGSVNSTTVHPREVVKEALRLNAAAVIMAHNHPSGEPTPSQQDISMTDKLKEILAVVDVRVLDHLIIGREVISLSELGLM